MGNVSFNGYQQQAIIPVDYNGNYINFASGIISGIGGNPVNGPGSSTDSAIATWNGTSGVLLKNNSITLSGTVFNSALGLTVQAGLGSAVLTSLQGSVIHNAPVGQITEQVAGNQQGAWTSSGLVVNNNVNAGASGIYNIGGAGNPFNIITTKEVRTALISGSEALSILGQASANNGLILGTTNASNIQISRAGTSRLTINALSSTFANSSLIASTSFTSPIITGTNFTVADAGSIIPQMSGIANIGARFLPFSGIFGNPILQSPNGSSWRLSVSDIGVVTAVSWP